MSRKYDNYGRDQIPIENVHGNVYIQESSRPVRSRSEFLLLQEVKQEVDSRLDQSLHNAVFINLCKQSQPQQVKRPLDAEIKIGSKLPEPLPAETTILEVFDRTGVDGRLLILGEPGAGKTTTLLDLAKGLCDQAEQDTTYFIPVLFNLSSWKDPKQTMTEWLVEELKSKYGVRKDIGKQWLTEKQLLPLLDGLDEVKPEHQESCVQAINRWLEGEDRPPHLAVCCRREEYETVIRGQWEEVDEQRDETRILLNGAILLQSLTDEQVQAYIAAANQLELWQMLRQDEDLWELMRSPLWLSITLLSYEELSLLQWQKTTSIEQRLGLLLDTYVQRMLHRELESKAFAKLKPPAKNKYLERLIYEVQFFCFKSLDPPTAKQTRYWLSYLADQLQQNSLTEISIEKIQPAWLDNQKKRGYQFRLNLFWILIYAPLLLLLPFVELSAHPIADCLIETCSQSGKVVMLSLVMTSLTCISLVALAIPYLPDEPILVKDTSRFWEGLKRSLPWTCFIRILLGLCILTAIFQRGEIIWRFLYFFSPVLSSILLVLILPLFFLVVREISNVSEKEHFRILAYRHRNFRLIDTLDVEEEIERIPNQGVRSAGKNLAICIAIGAIYAYLLCLPYILAEVSSSGSVDLLRLGLIGVIGAYVGLSVGMQLGGKCCIQHFFLRFILCRNNSIPWDYARFLDYCTERMFLQRVGGRYRFIHKYLQEHFAAMGSGE